MVSSTGTASLSPSSTPDAPPASPETLRRLAALEEVLSDMGRVLVAFSGGVDSALVLRVAGRVLGPQVLAFTADSPTYPPEELALAREMAAQWGIEHRIVQSEELRREGYAANLGDRCYHCKSELYLLARAEAARGGFAWICDGTITDDLGEHRPGLRAADEARVRHPLVEAGFDKASVREAAAHLGVPVWDKPAFSCLGSRFPVGTRVQVERVRQVQRVESVLRALGMRTFRARWHELEGTPMLRLELGPAEMGLLAQDALRQAVAEAARAEGFQWVTMDLEGYQRGRLSGPAR